MKVKTEELTGPALDWAVALASDYDEGWLHRQLRNPDPATRAIPEFSTDWSEGGPLIDENDISFRKYHKPGSPAHGTYYAKVCRENVTMVRWSKRDSTGPTALIAAMRCLVANKFGDEVEVPSELLQTKERQHGEVQE